MNERRNVTIDLFQWTKVTISNRFLSVVCGHVQWMDQYAAYCLLPDATMCSVNCTARVISIHGLKEEWNKFSRRIFSCLFMFHPGFSIYIEKWSRNNLFGLRFVLNNINCTRKLSQILRNVCKYTEHWWININKEYRICFAYDLRWIAGSRISRITL